MKFILAHLLEHYTLRVYSISGKDKGRFGDILERKKSVVNYIVEGGFMISLKEKNHNSFLSKK